MPCPSSAVLAAVDLKLKAILSADRPVPITFQPCPYLHGDPRKIDILRNRAAQKFSTKHPEDPRLPTGWQWTKAVRGKSGREIFVVLRDDHGRVRLVLSRKRGRQWTELPKSAVSRLREYVETAESNSASR